MRTLYIGACCFLALAVVLDLSGKNRFSFAAGSRAKSLQAEQSQREQIRQESKAALALGNRLAAAGMVMAAVGLASWIVSIIVGREQEKRPTPVLPLVLLAVYALLFFVAV